MSPRLRVGLDLLPLLGSQTGVGVFCRELLAVLDERPELDVSGYAVGRRAAAVRHLVPDATRVRTWPVPTRAAQMAWEYSHHPSAETLAGTLDIVHGTNFVVPPARRAAAVVTVHDLTSVRFPELCAPASLAYPELVRRAVGEGAFVHTHSHSVAAEVVALLDVPPERVRTVPPGVPPSPGAGGSGPPPVAPPYVLALGTIEPRKDHPTLVRAFAKVATAHPELRLVVAGPDGWGTLAFEEALAAAGVEDRVVRLGYVSAEDRAALVHHASVLAFPSIYEGFGFPPLEAMAAGVPVVATEAGSLGEVLGSAALIVPVGDAEALAGALHAVLGDAPLAADLGRRGLERAADFSWTATAEGISQLYAEAAAVRSGRRARRSRGAPS